MEDGTIIGKRFTQAISIILALFFVVALTVFAISCGQEEEDEKIGVVVSILPLADFVENISKGKVEVSVMVPPGASPHTYEPTPNQMVTLARAKVYIKVGSNIGFELVWMDKLVAINREMLVIDGSKGIQLLETMGEDTAEGEGYARGKDNGVVNPDIWMSPLNARRMVQNIYDGLVQIDPGNRGYYEQNRDTYLQQLTRLDQDIRAGLSGVTNRRFMVYHPAFGYFAEDYNLTMLPIEAEGKEPTAAGMAHLIEQAKENNIKVIFTSPQFNPQSAKVIAKAIGGRVVFIDPLARDYITNMRLVLGELVQAME